MSPTLALAVFGGAAPANLGIALDVRGPILSTANSCASGAVALGEALNAIRDGEIDAAIAGGVEVPLSPLAFGAFDIIRALGHGYNDDPQHASRPMDAGRDGFVMGEGAALLVLEAAEIAEARGARIYAEVMGYAATSDAHHMVQPRPDGREAGRAITLALEDAGVAPDEIDWVSAHASSTPIGDIAEARAIAGALGDRAATVPVSATKALTGHPLGATGAIEAAMATLAVHEGWVPGTVNLVAPEPDLAALLPCLLRRGPRWPLRPRPLDVVRLRRAQRGARARHAAGPDTRPQGARTRRPMHRRIADMRSRGTRRVPLGRWHRPSPCRPSPRGSDGSARPSSPSPPGPPTTPSG